MVPVHHNALPTILSLIITVGWDIVIGRFQLLYLYLTVTRYWDFAQYPVAPHDIGQTMSDFKIVTDVTRFPQRPRCFGNVWVGLQVGIRPPTTPPEKRADAGGEQTDARVT